MIQITLTETRYIKNPNTKTTYIVESVETSEVTERQHNLTTNDDTVKWFRRLGGKETVQKGYTCAGYVVVKLTSTSPDKETKVVREYKFKDIPLPANYDFENLSLYGKYMNLNGRGKLTKEVIQMFKDYKENTVLFEVLNNELNNLNKL